MDVIILTVESHNGIINYVSYFDKKGNLKKADFSKLNFDASNIDLKLLTIMIEAEEYNIERS